MTKSIYSLNKLKALARKTDRLNNHTPCHSERVADYALKLCRALNIRGKRKDAIITACLVHDTGKIVVDTSVWGKKERLTHKEMRFIKMHPAIAAKLAKAAGCSDKVAELIYYHHQWFNGNGYPDLKKQGSRIPIGARILAVCDAYEAMVSSRPYRRRIPAEEAIEELRRNAVRQFDPKIVEIFIKIVTENH